MIAKDKLEQVSTKARTHMGRPWPATLTPYYIELHKDSITIYKDSGPGLVKGTTFHVGDRAEYDSYNLSYMGVITKITSKAVTIVAYPNSNYPKTHRLDMNTFCWRNFNFNEADTMAANSETSMYI